MGLFLFVLEVVYIFYPHLSTAGVDREKSEHGVLIAKILKNQPILKVSSGVSSAMKEKPRFTKEIGEVILESLVTDRKSVV